MASQMEPGDIPASAVVTGDEVEFHDDPKILLPREMSFRKAHSVLERVEEYSETVVSHGKTYKYRPYDGAVATATIMKAKFGISFGEAKYTFFGKQPPETISVPTSVHETVEVPWGLVSIPAMDNTQFEIGQAKSGEHGLVFRLTASYPKKYERVIKEFFEEVAQQLKDHSIYRGKAIIGTGNPEFLDLSTFRPNEVVFADEVQKVLEGTIWSVLKYTKELRSEGVKIKRAGLMHGPYGCGKTSALQNTALIAVDNGWTYIKAGVGQDINEAMRTARLYAPSVLAVEDIDISASTSEDGEVTKLLETFDGITAKGADMVVVMTTNHLERIHKGMLRPGRLDAVVEIGELDRSGIERLIKAVVAKKRLAPDVDYDKVFEAMKVSVDHGDGIKIVHNFYPAFVRESLERAKTVAISLAGGSTDYVLDTEALVVAATSLHSQLKIMLVADEGERKPLLEQVMKGMVQNAMHDAKLVDDDGDFMGQVKTLVRTNGNG
jgi:transitional endoplasmic reticulum ATPase